MKYYIRDEDDNEIIKMFEEDDDFKLIFCKERFLFCQYLTKIQCQQLILGLTCMINDSLGDKK